MRLETGESAQTLPNFQRKDIAQVHSELDFFLFFPAPFIPGDENTQAITLKPAAMARQELLLLIGSAPIVSEQGVLRA